MTIKMYREFTSPFGGGGIHTQIFSFAYKIIPLNLLEEVEY